MVQQKSGNWGWRDLRNGAILQTTEALTLGLPFEVWKTRMGRFRTEGNFQAFANIYKRGGIKAYWDGAIPKSIESASKGAVYLYAKEALDSVLRNAGVSTTQSAFISGAGGGVAQTVIMGPCTFLVTAAVTGDRSVSLGQRVRAIWNAKGISGFYAGGTAVAVRQATNWASREGFTVGVRQIIRKMFHEGDMQARLSIPEEILAAAFGGSLACWNHPFEVVRIEMQATGNVEKGEEKKKLSMRETFKHIYVERGAFGFFRGVFPRIILGVYQTIFMVTIARIIKERGLL